MENENGKMRKWEISPNLTHTTADNVLSNNIYQNPFQAKLNLHVDTCIKFFYLMLLEHIRLHGCTMLSASVVINNC